MEKIRVPARIGLLINPEAGKILDVARCESKLIACLREGGADIVSHVSMGGVDLGNAAIRMVDGGCDALAVAGGDGSINQVLPVLVGRKVPLGVLPLGSVNLLSLELGIPRDVAAAARIPLGGKTKTIDVGCANGRFFLQVAGAGWDASILSCLRTRWQKRWMCLSLPFVGAAAMLRMRPQAWRIRSDGQDFCVTARGVVIANGSMYAGPFRLAPDVRHDDGKLDLFIVPNIPLGEVLRFLAGVATGARIYSGMRHLRASHLIIRPEVEVPAHADGEVCLRTPLEINVVPKAVSVFVP